MTAQLPLQQTCSRCGRPVLSLQELHHRAVNLAGASVRLAAAYSQMRLVIPQAMLDAMREIERGVPELSLGLACHARACTPRRAA
jgi:hypothetical protein